MGIDGSEATLIPLRRERPQEPLQTWRRAFPWVLAGLLAIAVLTLSIGFFSHAPQPTAMHFRTVTNFAGVQAQPSLSPDGRSVAFVSNRNGHYDIYVGLISGGSLVQITADINLKSHPSWSPDGSTIAFARLNESGIEGAFRETELQVAGVDGDGRMSDAPRKVDPADAQ